METPQEAGSEAEFPAALQAARDEVIVLVYNGKNYAIPRPMTYEAALDTVRKYILRSTGDLSGDEVSFTGKVQWLAEGKEVEITPPVWGFITPELHTLRLNVAEKKNTKKPNPPPSQAHPPATVTPSRPPPGTITLTVRVGHVTSGPTLTVQAHPSDTISDLKAKIRTGSLNWPDDYPLRLHITSNPPSGSISKALVDKDSLAQCGISDGAALFAA